MLSKAQIQDIKDLIKAAMPKGWEGYVRYVERREELKLIITKMPKADFEKMGYDKPSDYYINVGIFNKNADNWEQETIEVNRKMQQGWLPEYANVKGNFKANEIVKEFELYIPEGSTLYRAKETFDTRKEFTKAILNVFGSAANKYNYDDSDVMRDYFNRGYTSLLMFGTEKKPCKLI